MKHNLLTLAIILIISSSCAKKSKEDIVLCIESPKGVITSDEECTLDENISYISDVLQFEILSDSTFATWTEEQVYIYNMDGKQISLLGRGGRGRGEYISPRAMTTYGDHIFVASSNKVTEYTNDGKFVEQYKQRGAIWDLEVCDKYIYLYGDIPSDNKSYYLQKYDKDKQEVIATLGEYDNVGKILRNVTFFNGYVSATDDEVLIISPSDLTLNKFTDNAQELLMDIDSPSYQIDTDVSYKAITQPPFENLTNYVENNSIVMCASIYNDKLYIVTNENFGGESIDKFVAERHLLVIDMKSRRGEYRQIEQSRSTTEVYYQIYKGEVYSLAYTKGIPSIRKMNM